MSFELGSIIFRSKRTELRKKLSEPIRDKFFDFRKKKFWLITLELLGISS